MKAKDYCKKVFDKEIQRECLDGVTLKIINAPLNNSNGYVNPNLKKETYQIVINLNSFKNLSEEDKKFYIYETISHEIEHIKTFQRTQEEDFIDYDHFMSILEYISYLYELKQPALNMNMSLVKKILLSKRMNKNYDVSSNELKASLEGYKKAKQYSESDKDSIKVDIILSSIEFLNDNMEIIYDRYNVPNIKMNMFLRNASIYIKRYPEILDKYKSLKLIFNENGIKSIEELYCVRNDKNAKIIDNVVLGIINLNNIPEDENIRDYISNLIVNYNHKVINYYKNMNIGKVFIDDEKKLNENMNIMLKRVKYLNMILKSMNRKNEYGLIL